MSADGQWIYIADFGERKVYRYDDAGNLTEIVDATRIATALHLFNRRWSRRVLGQNAVVLLITDGLDRDVSHSLRFEAERLTKSCHRLIWLNPLLRYEGFEAKAAGIQALMPYVDDFRPMHNLNSFRSLVEALSSRR